LKKRYSDLLEKRDYVNILLVIDYEQHDDSFSDEKIIRLQHFCDITRDGLLYTNYPMVEAYLHFCEYPDPRYIERYFSVDECKPGKECKRLVDDSSAIISKFSIIPSIRDFLRKRKSNLLDKDAIEIISIILNLDQEELFIDLEKVLDDYGFAPEKRNNIKYSIRKHIVDFQNIYDCFDLWNELRILMLYIARENIEKAYFIQSGFSRESNIKESYYGIDWLEVLKM
jgi:hypothetical protein